MVIVLLGVVLIIFLINSFAPGDPVINMIGTSFTQEQYDTVKHELGLDQPLLVRYVQYVKGIVTEFDFGISYQTKQAIADELVRRMPISILLAILSVTLTVILGIPCGVASATRQYSALDYTVTAASLFFAAMPSFWLALMLIIIFSLNLGWFPASGVDTWKAWVLPCLAVGLSPIATVARTTRSSMLEVIRQDYIRTAKSKGLSSSRIIWKHALKNALIPVVTVVGMQLGLVMGGSMVVEVIFNIPGLGTMLLNAINNQDYPVIQGCVLVISFVVCFMSLAVDILYAYIDPRIKSQYASGKRGRKTAKKQMQVEGGACG